MVVEKFDDLRPFRSASARVIDDDSFISVARRTNTAELEGELYKDGVREVKVSRDQLTRTSLKHSTSTFICWYM